MSKWAVMAIFQGFRVYISGGIMNDGTPFKNLKLNGKPLNECELALECNGTHYRLYIDRGEEGHVFYALAVEFVSSVSEDTWTCPHLTVEPLFNVTAYFDGVRHLEFNREAGDMAGYIYYPNMQGLIELMQKVREVELEVCRDCEQ